MHSHLAILQLSYLQSFQQHIHLKCLFLGALLWLKPALCITTDDSLFVEWVRTGDSIKVALWLEEGGDTNFGLENGNTPLVWAVANGNMSLTRLLIEHGADVNFGGQRSYYPIHAAVGSDDTLMVSYLIKEGSDLSLKTDFGATPFALSVFWGRLAAMKYLINFGTDINEEFAYDRIGSKRPLFCAASNGNLAMLMVLIDAGADIESCDSEGNTPLMLAWNSEATPGLFCGNTYVTESMVVWSGKETFFYLLHQGADTSRWMPTPEELLIRGSKYDCPELLERAIAKGASPIISIPMELGSGEMGYKKVTDDVRGRQLIHLAAKFGAASSMEWLLSHGAKPDIPDTNGATPFDWALANDAVKSITFLIQQGIPFDNLDSTRTTPLQKALTGNKFNAAKVLVAAGADLRKVDLSDPQPMINSIYWNNDSMITTLEKWGFGIDTPNSGGYRPLHYAAQGDNAPLCEYLIDRGADLNRPDNNTATPLAWAMKHDGYNIRQKSVKILVERGADVNKAWGSNETALKWAVIFEDIEIARLLLENGANPNFLDGAGLSPLGYCRGAQSVEMAELLFEFEVNTLPSLPQNQKALIAAANLKDVGLFDFLSAKGFYADFKQNTTNDSPLYLAVSEGNAEMTRRLLKKKEDLSKYSSEDEPIWSDNNIFKIAAIKGDTITMRILIESGMNVDLGIRQFYQQDLPELVNMVIDRRRKRNEKPLVTEEAALYWTAYYNAFRSAKLLLEAGVDPNIKDRHQQTPLWWAVNAPEDFQRREVAKPEVVDVLISHGASVDQTEAAGHNLLCFSCTVGADWMVSRLLKAGAPVESQQFGRRAIHWAAHSGSLTTVKLLVDAGVNTSISDFKGYTPYSIAIEKGYNDISAYLQNIGACQPKAELSPEERLFEAILSENIEEVVEALKQGIPLNSITKDGIYPLNIAVRIGNVEIVKILIKNGAIAGILQNNKKETMDYLFESDNIELYKACGFQKRYNERQRYRSYIKK